MSAMIVWLRPDKWEQMAATSAGLEHRGKIPLALRQRKAEIAEFHAQKLVIKKNQGVQRHFLGTGRNMSLHGQPGQKFPDLPSPGRFGTAAANETNKPPDPVNISLFGPDAVTAKTHVPTKRIKKWAAHRKTQYTVFINSITD